MNDRLVLESSSSNPLSRSSRVRSAPWAAWVAALLGLSWVISCGEADSSAIHTPSAGGMAGSGGSAGRTSGGVTSSGGRVTSGGASTGGFHSPSGGLHNAGSAGEAGSDAGAPSAGAGGAPPEPQGGQGGEVEAPSCGNGKRDAGEMCCSRAFVDSEIELMMASAVEQAPGTHSCVDRQRSAGFDVCSSAACLDQQPGCDAEITDASADYDASSRSVSGTIDMIVRGRLAIGSGNLACDFTATIDDLAYTADVVSAVSSQATEISLENLVLDYVVQVRNCSLGVAGAEEALGEVAKTLIEPRIIAEIGETFRRRVECPL